MCNHSASQAFVTDVVCISNAASATFSHAEY